MSQLHLKAAFESQNITTTSPDGCDIRVGDRVETIAQGQQRGEVTGFFKRGDTDYVQHKHESGRTFTSPLDNVRKIDEDAAGAGTPIAGGMAMPLFAKLVRHVTPTTSHDDTPDDEDGNAEEDDVESPSLKEVFTALVHESSDVDTEAVIAKLKGLQHSETTDRRDCVTFGLEDDNEQIVRVMVRRDQAVEFEKALEQFLASADVDGEPIDVAEILFQLKDRFDFVDVVWPEIEEDEEDFVGADPADVDPNLDGATSQQSDAEDQASVDADASSMLQQVLQMMTADAEARMAEARAREAEAKVAAAAATAQQAVLRVKQEEQLLDMETQQKAAKDQDREAQRLAKLAKWQSELESGEIDNSPVSAAPQPSTSPQFSDEEMGVLRRSAPATRPKGRSSPQDVASYILSRIRRD